MLAGRSPRRHGLGISKVDNSSSTIRIGRHGTIENKEETLSTAPYTECQYHGLRSRGLIDRILDANGSQHVEFVRG